MVLVLRPLVHKIVGVGAFRHELLSVVWKQTKGFVIAATQLPEGMLCQCVGKTQICQNFTFLYVATLRCFRFSFFGFSLFFWDNFVTPMVLLGLGTKATSLGLEEDYVLKMPVFLVTNTT